MPCDLSWKVLQPNAIETDGRHEIDELVEVNNNFNHGILVATCSDPNIKDYYKSLHLYTNS